MSRTFRSVLCGIAAWIAVICELEAGVALVESSKVNDVLMEKSLSSAQSDLVYFTSTAMDIEVYDNGHDVTPIDWDMGVVKELKLKPSRSHLMAVKLKLGEFAVSDEEEPPPPGLIMSIDKHLTADVRYGHTDSSWRCTVGSTNKDTLTPDTPWYNVEFDDWSWKSAQSLSRNGDKPYIPMEAISGEAQWIWTGEHNPGMEEAEEVVYCRGWLSEFPDTLWVGSGAPKTKVVAYGDGERLGDSNTIARRAAQYILPGQDNHVVAIYAKVASKKSTRGFIASLQIPKPPGGVTGNLWRCKESLSPAEVGTWMLPSFDDSSWPQAAALAAHDEDPYTIVLNVSPFAQWIWAKMDEDVEAQAALEVYCRSSIMASNGGGLHKKTTACESAEDDSEFPPLLIQARDMTVAELTAEEANDMSNEDFVKEYIKANRPVKIKGGIKHWPAVGKWTDAYLRQKLGDMSTAVTLAPDHDDVFYFYSEKKTLKNMPLWQFLDTYQSPGTQGKQYLAQHPLKRPGKSPALNRRIASDIERPRFSNYLEIDAVNLWMGPGHQVTPIHFDNSENFMCVVDGFKKFRLYEPGMSNFIYPVRHNERTGITSRIRNFSQTDFVTYPKSANLKPVFVDVSAGDILYLPAYWWHEVTSEGRNVAVNWWFRSHSSLLDSLYVSWVSSLPQTKWGAKSQHEYEVMAEKTGIRDDVDVENSKLEEESRRRRSPKRDEL